MDEVALNESLPLQVEEKEVSQLQIMDSKEGESKVSSFNHKKIRSSSDNNEDINTEKASEYSNFVDNLIAQDIPSSPSPDLLDILSTNDSFKISNIEQNESTLNTPQQEVNSLKKHPSLSKVAKDIREMKNGVNAFKEEVLSKKLFFFYSEYDYAKANMEKCQKTASKFKNDEASLLSALLISYGQEAISKHFETSNEIENISETSSLDVSPTKEDEEKEEVKKKEEEEDPVETELKKIESSLNYTLPLNPLVNKTNVLPSSSSSFFMTSDEEDINNHENQPLSMNRIPEEQHSELLQATNNVKNDNEYLNEDATTTTDDDDDRSLKRNSIGKNQKAEKY